MILHFGDGYANHISKHFTHEEIASLDACIIGFIKEAGDKIKETMVSDYFKMVKP
ncbi:hypothetical protein RWE15_22845 [Virgibacillus halophilus]|uniref:Uncharacterized protein n=1 Tax=Tigheibacillus halophilus TaxID=361280 RepID=A0ABU5CBA6_9BACI|nr:hypothetical protein [Virgibacillus halophilus]